MTLFDKVAALKQQILCGLFHDSVNSSGSRKTHQSQEFITVNKWYSWAQVISDGAQVHHRFFAAQRIHSDFCKMLSKMKTGLIFLCENTKTRN